MRRFSDTPNFKPTRVFFWGVEHENRFKNMHSSLGVKPIFLSWMDGQPLLRKDGLSLALQTAVHNFMTVKALYYNWSGFPPIQDPLFERSGVVGWARWAWTEYCFIWYVGNWSVPSMIVRELKSGLIHLQKLSCQFCVVIVLTFLVGEFLREFLRVTIMFIYTYHTTICISASVLLSPDPSGCCHNFWMDPQRRKQCHRRLSSMPLFVEVVFGSRNQAKQQTVGLD